LPDQATHLQATRSSGEVSPASLTSTSASSSLHKMWVIERRSRTLTIKPQVVAEVEFLEWTGADHLRHTKFVSLRDDKDPRKVVRET
jgi:ATP-dependent DNA ligase